MLELKYATLFAFVLMVGIGGMVAFVGVGIRDRWPMWRLLAVVLAWSLLTAAGLVVAGLSV